MREFKGDLWTYHRNNAWVAITTNGFIKRDGSAVMGRGCAYEASIKFPQLPYELAQHMNTKGNVVGRFPQYSLLTFPVKHNWFEVADLDLIEKSCIQLKDMFYQLSRAGQPITTCFLARPGCGNGNLKWDQVKPILDKHFQDEDRLVIVSRPGEV